MNKVLLLVPGLLLVVSISNAYAEPLKDTNVAVLEYDGTFATVQTAWNHDSSVAKYEIGCVSCMPNISEFTSTESLTLDNVTPFPNSSHAMLYLIAYDLQDEIIHARQILVELGQ